LNTEELVIFVSIWAIVLLVSFFWVVSWSLGLVVGRVVSTLVLVQLSCTSMRWATL
jgi:hypothetical protein